MGVGIEFQKDQVMVENYQRVDGLRTFYEKKTGYLPDSFQLREDRGYVWLQKIALWVLKKLGCYAIKTEQVAVKVVIDTKKIVDKVMIQDEELAKLYHYRGSRLLVGHEEFREMCRVEMSHPLSLSAQYIWQERASTMTEPYKVTRTACGLKVTVIPWMRGVLVLPKDFDQNGMD